MNLNKPYNNGVLTGNQLKIIAVLAMTVDHIGVYLLPQFLFLRIIGRLAFPIFAYMIAEGCRYTKNRKRYLGTILLLGIACQVVYFFALGSLFQCIFITFSLSIVLIYTYDYTKANKDVKSFCALIGALGAVFFLTEILPVVLVRTDYRIDYGWQGVLVPILVYIGKNKGEKLLLLSFGLTFLALDTRGIQWFSLATVPLLALYSGERGRVRMKNFFYIYYPLHLVVIYLIGLLVR